MGDPNLSEALRDNQSQQETFRVHKGDSRRLTELLERYFTSEALSDQLVDVTITSPPYADLKNYKGDEDTQIGFGDTYAEYLEQLREIFQQVYDITADTGTLWVVVNTFRRDSRVTRLPSDIADICENIPGRKSCERCGAPVERQRDSGKLVCRAESCGYVHNVVEASWRLQDVIIWDKQRARPYADANTFRNVFEYILCFSKTRDPSFDIDSVRIADTSQFKHWWVDWPERYHPRGKVPENIWEMVTPSQGRWGARDYDHPAPFPQALVERIVRLTTDPGDIVLDPFAGTGTVPIQANLMERHGIGFDASSDYVDDYDTNQKALSDQWEARRQEGNTLEQQQGELSKIIWGLRQLVYAKHLFKRLRREIPSVGGAESAMHSIFVQGKNLDPTQVDTDDSSIEAHIHFAFNEASEDRLKEAERVIRSCRDESPWSGFNLDVKGHTWLATEIEERVLDEIWGSRRKLFLYPFGHHHKYQRLITRSQWREAVATPDAWREQYATESYVPLISNISIQINRDGDVPTVERGLDDEPPEEIETEFDYEEQALFETVSTTLTDFKK